jgi:hypothetical protein
LLQEVQLNLALTPAPKEIVVIPVERFGGKYLAIGVHYEQVVPENLPVIDQIAKYMDILLANRPISELLEFIRKEDKDWKQIADELLADE